MGDLLPPKRQAVVERLGRRLEYYRRHRDSVLPRYDIAESGSLDHTRQETLMLRQRFLDSKLAKKVGAKKSSANSCLGDGRISKMTGPITSQPLEMPTANDSHRSLEHQKIYKRTASEAFGESPLDSSTGHAEQPDDSDRLGPSHKNMKDQCNPQDQNNGMTSFSVQIVQQFSSNNNTQAPHSQTIQTNVTVKALSGNNSAGGIKTSGSPLPQQQASVPCDPSSKQIFKECKQEKVDCDFQPQCSVSSSNSANVERFTADSLNFGLMSDDGVDDVINADLFQDLINDVFTNTSNADLMKEFNFESVKEPADVTREPNEDPGFGNPASIPPISTDETSTKTSATATNHPNVSSTPPQYSSSPSSLGNSGMNMFDIQQHQSVSNIAPIAPSSGSRIPPPIDVIQSPGSGPSPAAQTLKQMAEQHQQQKQQHIGSGPHQRAPFVDSRDFFSNSQNQTVPSYNSMPQKSMYNTPFSVQQPNMFANSPSDPNTQMENEVQNRKVMQLQQQLNRITDQKSPPPGYGSTKPLSHFAETPVNSVAGGINIQQQQHVNAGQYMRGPNGANVPTSTPQQPQQFISGGNRPTTNSANNVASNIQISQNQHFTQANKQIQATQRQQIQIQDIKPQQQQMFSFQQQQQLAARQTQDLQQISQSQSTSFTSYNNIRNPHPTANPNAMNSMSYAKMDQPHIRGNMKQITRMKMAQMQRQQQMMQQQQQQPRRPPPPEYRNQRPAAPDTMVLQTQQQPNTHFPPQTMPMQRATYRAPAMMGQMTQRHLIPNEQVPTTYTGASFRGHRPPNINAGPEGINITSQKSQEWRQMVISQQQQQRFQSQVASNSQVRTAYMGGGFPPANNNNNSIGLPQMNQMRMPATYVQRQPQQQRLAPAHQLPQQGVAAEPMLNVEMSSSISLANNFHQNQSVASNSKPVTTTTSSASNDGYGFDFLDIDGNATNEILNIDQVMEMIG